MMSHRLNRRIPGVLAPVLALTTACGGSSPTQTPIDDEPGDVSGLLFENSFEEADLFPRDGSVWSNLVLQTPEGADEASFQAVTERARTGSRSGKFSAPPGGQGLNCGKASVIRKQTLALGDTVTVTAAYWLDAPIGTATPQLMDIECSPADCGYVGSPGVRLVTTQEGRLRIDWKFLNWFANNNLPPPSDAPPPSPSGSTTLPVGRWFTAGLRMRLGRGSEGLTEVLLDGRVEVSVQGTNLSPEGMANLTEYSGVEVGVTCNPTNSVEAATLYVDDVRIER